MKKGHFLKILLRHSNNFIKQKSFLTKNYPGKHPSQGQKLKNELKQIFFGTPCTSKQDNSDSRVTFMTEKYLVSYSVLRWLLKFNKCWNDELSALLSVNQSVEHLTKSKHNDSK